MVRKIAPLVVLWLVAVAYAVGDAQAPGPKAPGPAAAATTRRAGPSGPAAQSGSAGEPGDGDFVKQYCVTCHNQRLKTGGLVLETLNVDGVGPDAETWEKVVRKVSTGMMPPAGARRPERAALDAFAANIAARLDRAADPKANLTTPALHRLNRTEYKNAIHDLLDLDVDVATLLPNDGSSEGFDNIAEALSVSPSLIQGYVSAALKISRLAVGDRSIAPQQVVYQAPPALAQDRHIEGLPLGTRGGMLIHHMFPLDAEYEFQIGGGIGGPGAAGPGGPATDFTIDGEKVPVQNTRKFRVKVAAGPHDIGVALVDRTRGPGVDEIYSDFRVNGVFVPGGGIQNVTVTGPFDPTGVGDTPSRRRIFACRPASAAEETPCARRILSTVAKRAYRGAVTESEMTTLLKFYEQGRTGADFDTGIQEALARILVAPRFVFRSEQEPAGVAPGAIYRISDIDLASRLSFFLWSTVPDDELLDLGLKNRLHEPAVLEKQVKRMIADPKSKALIENFAGQWLLLRDLASVQTEAKHFDDNLRESFRKETELLFDSIVHEDRPLTELLDADYTFVDERLAQHYGIPNVHGSYFRRVQLPPNSPRRGVLGQGSMLTVTSVATRTSPVERGKWILENLLGVPPPSPPAGVNTNLDAETAPKNATLRQRLELHRSSPVCASCHNIMDPMGFALENFDLVGAWREKDGVSPIDSSGKLADGTPLKGVDDLRNAILSRSNAFMTVAAQKLFTYALGRPTTYLDMPDVRAIVRRSTADQNRFSALVLGVIESGPFQKRIKAARSTE